MLLDPLPDRNVVNLTFAIWRPCFFDQSYRVFPFGLFLVRRTLCRALKPQAITIGYLALRLTLSIKHLNASLSAPGLT